jgi:hypothetical protein
MAKSNREKQNDFRKRRYAAGLAQRTLWVHKSKLPEFAALEKALCDPTTQITGVVVRDDATGQVRTIRL